MIYVDRYNIAYSLLEPLRQPSESHPEAPIGKPVVTEVTSQSCLLSWRGPAFDGGSIVEGYRVEMCKYSLLKISHEFWRTLTDMCRVSEGLCQVLS